MASGTPLRGSPRSPPFPTEWKDELDPNVHQASIQEIHDHVKDYLDADDENPLEDAPVETPMPEDWSCLAAETTTPQFLNFLSDQGGDGLAFAPVGRT